MTNILGSGSMKPVTNGITSWTDMARRTACGKRRSGSDLWVTGSLSVLKTEVSGIPPWASTVMLTTGFCATYA